MASNPSLTAPIEVMRACAHACLSTIMRAGDAAAGWPYASLAAVAFDHDGRALTLLSDLAAHSANMAACDRVSLLFAPPPTGAGDRLAAARVTVIGHMRISDEPRHRARFLARHPDAERYAGLGDFRIRVVDPTAAHVVSGFGAVQRLGPDAVTTTPAPALIEAESDIIAHMNADHADALDRIAARLLGRGGEGWRMTGIDPDGFDVRLGQTVARCTFDSAIGDASAARAALVALARRAR